MYVCASRSPLYHGKVARIDVEKPIHSGAVVVYIVQQKADSNNLVISSKSLSCYPHHVCMPVKPLNGLLLPHVPPMCRDLLVKQPERVNKPKKTEPHQCKHIATALVNKSPQRPSTSPLPFIPQISTTLPLDLLKNLQSSYIFPAPLH